jgi:hypothetical protein
MPRKEPGVGRRLCPGVSRERAPRATKVINMMETTEDRKERKLRTYVMYSTRRQSQSLPTRVVLFSVEEQKNTAGTWL